MMIASDDEKANESEKCRGEQEEKNRKEIKQQ